MSAADSPPELTPAKVRGILTEWFARRAVKIAFRENTAPKHDSDDDYVIAYEAMFEPPLIDQAYAEIWVTADGYVAVGFEKRKRVAARLGVRTGSDRFAAGHEPLRVGEAGLVSLLDMIADGHISISATVVPIIGLVSTKAVVLETALESLNSKGYAPVNWLHAVAELEFSRSKNLLRYQRWM